MYSRPVSLNWKVENGISWTYNKGKQVFLWSFCNSYDDLPGPVAGSRPTFHLSNLFHCNFLIIPMSYFYYGKKLSKMNKVYNVGDRLDAYLIPH